MGQRIFLALRSALYICGFLLLWLWLMPQWLNIRRKTGFPSHHSARWFGLLLLVPGAIIAISCFVNFFVMGKGTPAPFDAPRHLVISGPYRYVRNPMYLGAGLVLLGYALAIILLVNLFVFFYEEPTLRDKFGAEYLEYCKNVRRWIPRRSAWEHSRKQAVAAR